MNRKLIVLGLFFCVAIFIFGCSQVAAPPIPSGDSSYFPNTDGYKWNYRYTPSGQASGTMARSFNGTQTFNGIVCQKYVYEQDFAASSEGLMKVSATDVKYYGAASAPTTDAYVILEFPLEVGSHWVLNGSYTATVEAYESITVPAGTYNAFRVLEDYGTPSSRYHYWYAKDVGIVAFEIYWVSGMITAELTSRNF